MRRRNTDLHTSLTAPVVRALVDARNARADVPGDKQGRAGTNRLLSRLRHFCGWCIERGYLTSSPFQAQPGTPPVRLIRGCEQPRRRRLMPGEEDRLLAGANAPLKGLIIAAVDTGMRLGELLSLTVADIDGSRNVLTVRGEVSKTSTAWEVPMTSRVQAVVAMRQTAPDGEPHPPESYVFGDVCGSPIVSIRTAWHNACELAHISGLHFHDLRREAGSRLLEAAEGTARQKAQASTPQPETRNDAPCEDLAMAPADVTVH